MIKIIGVLVAGLLVLGGLTACPGRECKEGYQREQVVDAQGGKTCTRVQSCRDGRWDEGVINAKSCRDVEPEG